MMHLSCFRAALAFLTALVGPVVMLLVNCCVFRCESGFVLLIWLDVRLPNDVSVGFHSFCHLQQSGFKLNSVCYFQFHSAAVESVDKPDPSKPNTQKKKKPNQESQLPESDKKEWEA